MSAALDPPAGPACTAPSWLRRHDPDLTAVRRAGRVTVAGCVGFYVCLYLLDDAALATYAVFGAVSLGVLSDVTGTPTQRTRAYLGALPVGLALVTAGTLLAVNVWAAVAGMLVFGFAVAYSAVGGPRLAGLANGLQLLYILPCFPPYDPGSLPSRLAGLTVGLALMAVADRVLWPAPAPRDYADRLADAAEPVGRYLDAVRMALTTTADPAALHGPRLTALRSAAAAAGNGLRPERLPLAERPAGPGVRDRSLTFVASGLRSVAARTAGLAKLLDDPELRPNHPMAPDLLAAVHRSINAVPAALRGTAPPPALEPLDAALATFLGQRSAILTADQDDLERHPGLRVGAAATALAESARTVVVAVTAAVGAPAPAAVAAGTVAPGTFSYLHRSAAGRWWRRLRAHLTPRSVYLQNAVRLALGLAAALVIAQELDISHGFWVLRATLTLMRTSLVASGAALVPAFTGVVAGAVVAGLLLTVVGDAITVYAVTLPVLMLVGFAAGPILGAAAGQAGFTVVIAVLFAQLAPADWRLAETRLLDVVLGGLVGAVIGAAVWPRGGRGELRRGAAAALRAVADDIVATAARLTGRGGGGGTGDTGDLPDVPDRQAHHLIDLFDATFAQYSSEGVRRPSGTDWLTVLAVVHRIPADVDVLRGRYPEPGPLPWAPVADQLSGVARDAADAVRRCADAVAGGHPPPADPGPAMHARLTAHPPKAPYAQAPPAALRVVDLWGWLHGSADTLTRLHQALVPDTARRGQLLGAGSGRRR
ncbi:MAG: FUSC family protein [Pseudonocardia sp.]